MEVAPYYIFVSNTVCVFPYKSAYECIGGTTGPKECVTPPVVINYELYYWRHMTTWNWQHNREWLII